MKVTWVEERYTNIQTLIVLKDNKRHLTRKSNCAVICCASVGFLKFLRTLMGFSLLFTNYCMIVKLSSKILLVIIIVSSFSHLSSLTRDKYFCAKLTVIFQKMFASILVSFVRKSVVSLVQSICIILHLRMSAYTTDVCIIWLFTISNHCFVLDLHD